MVIMMLMMLLVLLVLLISLCIILLYYIVQFFFFLTVSLSHSLTVCLTHCLNTSEVTQSLFQMLATSAAGPVVKSFQEVWLEFVPFEARAFHVNMPGCQLLRPGTESSPLSMAELETVASRLVSLIVSMNELPQLKYRQDSGTSARLATLVQQGLDRYCARNPSFRPVPGGDFLICDRRIDLVTPLLHEFTYQAMCQDLLPIHHGNRFDLKGGGKTVALDENDSLWTGLRHCHIADCSKAIVSKFNQFLTDNKAAVKSKTIGNTGNTGNVSSLAEMKEAINALGEFQELKAQVSRY
jgi:syntaxin-binding protein 1